MLETEASYVVPTLKVSEPRLRKYLVQSGTLIVTIGCKRKLEVLTILIKAASQYTRGRCAVPFSWAPEERYLPLLPKDTAQFGGAREPTLPLVYWDSSNNDCFFTGPLT